MPSRLVTSAGGGGISSIGSDIDGGGGGKEGEGGRTGWIGGEGGDGSFSV